MIRYDLACINGHTFDGWFQNSSAYDAQAAASHIACPHCGSVDIDKQLMTPAIPTKSNRKEPQPSPHFAAQIDAKSNALIKTIRKLRKHVEENAEYVGDKFAEEARRIHYDESSARGIYGETSPAEAAELIEEGIEVHPLPRLPEDRN